MGYYTEYLDQQLNFEQLSKLRKKQLQIISKLRKRDVLVYAADHNKAQAPISISYEDLVPLNDQISNLKQDDLDFIIETPGGIGEIAESIIRTLRERFGNLGVIIPGSAMSAGTIIAMSGDEILMHRHQSSLGPIDAQLLQNGKQFSAHAFLEGIEKIKTEAKKDGLNHAYIPILQVISPGEIEHARNAQDFSHDVVTECLMKYKFRDWNTHSSSGKPVTEQDKVERAQQIAKVLCDHGRWKTHGRRIRLSDLESMRLKVTDYSRDMPELCEAIERYYALLHITFSRTDIYKIYETPTAQILKSQRTIQQAQPQQAQPQTAAPATKNMIAELDINCKCGIKSKIQANLGVAQPLTEGKLAYPPDDRFKCPGCGRQNDLTKIRAQIEKESGKKIII
ncbi:MAG: SDH family Clp fold serine proteinase [Gammaproteobacteria bacterium]